MGVGDMTTETEHQAREVMRWIIRMAVATHPEILFTKDPQRTDGKTYGATLQEMLDKKG